MRDYCQPYTSTEQEGQLVITYPACRDKSSESTSLLLPLIGYDFCIWWLPRWPVEEKMGSHQRLRKMKSSSSSCNNSQQALNPRGRWNNYVGSQYGGRQTQQQQISLQYQRWQGCRLVAMESSPSSPERKRNRHRYRYRQTSVNEFILAPRLLCGRGGKRAWYTLFAHAPSSLGNLHTTPLH